MPLVPAIDSVSLFLRCRSPPALENATNGLGRHFEKFCKLGVCKLRSLLCQSNAIGRLQGRNLSVDSANAFESIRRQSLRRFPAPGILFLDGSLAYRPFWHSLPARVVVGSRGSFDASSRALQKSSQSWAVENLV